jgi:hypothetical protein
MREALGSEMGMNSIVERDSPGVLGGWVTEQEV